VTDGGIIGGAAMAGGTVAEDVVAGDDGAAGGAEGAASGIEWGGGGIASAGGGAAAVAGGVAGCAAEYAMPAGGGNGGSAGAGT
jgi:hypothetical protein